MSSQAYFNNDVRTTSAETLVTRLLDRALRCAREARALDCSGQFAERAPLLRRSIDIVAELQNSLDFQQGGEIATNLDALYEFVSSRLLVGALPEGDAAIDEAVPILEILADTWRELPRALAVARAASETPMPSDQRGA